MFNLIPDISLEIKAYTDNQSLYDILHTTKQPSEKRLVVDIAALREIIETK